MDGDGRGGLDRPRQRMRRAVLLSLACAARPLLAQSPARPPIPAADYALAAEPTAPVEERVLALVRLLAPHGVGLKPGATVGAILRDTLVSRCHLAPAPAPDTPEPAALDSLTRLSERLYGAPGPPALRLFARCARLALADRAWPPEWSGVVAGIVRDTAGQPIAGAEIVAMAAKRRGRSDDRGAFAMPWLEPGPELFVVRAIGYAPERFTVTLAAGDTMPLEVTLRRAPAQLPELTVTARGQEYRGRLADFARRMLSEPVPASRFVSRKDLDRWALFDLANVFRRAGLTPRGNQLSCSALGAGNPPRMGVYLDGQLYSEAPEFDLTVVPVSWVEGIEVYKRTVEIPMEFARPGFGCVVLIWTREP